MKLVKMWLVSFWGDINTERKLIKNLNKCFLLEALETGTKTSNEIYDNSLNFIEEYLRLLNYTYESTHNYYGLYLL